MRNLAKYANGLTMTQNEEKAQYWIENPADCGDDDAMIIIKMLNSIP